MSISQESLFLISMPNSAITVSQMNIPLKTHFQKAVGGVKKFFCGHSSRMKVTSILNFVLNSSACMQKNSSNSFKYWEASIFISDNGVLTVFCFLKTMGVLGHQESDFQSHSMPLSVRKMSGRIV